MRGLSLGLSLGAQQAGGGAPAFDFYVDSVNGDDGNDGTSEAAAFQSFAPITWANDLRVGLAAGSSAAPFSVGSATGVTVEGYGDLAGAGLPVIRGDEVITGTWATSADRSDALDNTYSIDAALDDLGFITAFEGDLPLKWVASAAAVDAEAGTFFVAGNAAPAEAGTYTMYIHPRGSTNPNSDGKTYAYARRAAPALGVGGTLRNAVAMRTVTRNGIRFGGGAGRLENALLIDVSPVHDALMGSGLYQKVAVFNRTVDNREGHIGLEFFASTATGLTGAYRRCVYVGNGLGMQLAFGGHSGDGSSYAQIESEDCAASGARFGLSIEAVEIVATRPRIVGDRMDIFSQTSGTVTVTDPWIDVRGGAVMTGATFGPTATVDGLRLYGDTSTAGIAGWVDLTLSRSVFVRDTTVFRSRGPWRTTGSTLAMTGVAYDGNFQRNFAAASYSGDVNVFGAAINAEVAGTNRTTLSAHQTATGQDANSVVMAPAVADAANGNFTLTASGLPANVGLERDPTCQNYTPIPATLAEAEAWIVGA